MLNQVPRDVWIGLAAMVLAGTYWYGADQIPISALDGVVNAAAMPKALAYALAGLALVLIFRALTIEIITRRATTETAEAAPSAGAAVTEEKEWEDAASWRKRHLRAAGMLGIGIVYLIAIPYLGYMLSIALLVFGVAAFMQARPDRKLLLLSGCVAVFFYLLFVRFLDIPLPPGFWPSLFT